MMIKTVFLVPVRDNEGQPFVRLFWRELESRLIAAFGAFSRISGVIGAWESRGRIYRDRSRQYVVSLTSWRQLPGWLALVDWVRDATRQEAIYIEVAGVPEILEGQ